jgi:hypothetical protein
MFEIIFKFKHVEMIYSFNEPSRAFVQILHIYEYNLYKYMLLYTNKRIVNLNLNNF